MTVHLPERPDWCCRGCGNPWPCEPACRNVAREYAEAPASRHVFLTDLAALAAFDRCADADRGATIIGRILAVRDAA